MKFRPVKNQFIAVACVFLNTLPISSLLYKFSPLVDFRCSYLNPLTPRSYVLAATLFVLFCFCRIWKLFANLLTLSHGALMGWMSPSLLVLQSPESPLGHLTTDQLSWIGSISYLGGFFGTFICMRIIKALGRKKTFCVLAIPNFIFWLVVLLGRKVEYLYAARVIGGLSGGGMYIAVPLLVTEIADDEIRGILGSMLMISACLGIMIAFVGGYLMTYETLPYVLMIFPIALFVSYLILPDTPMALMLKNKPLAAEKSLKFYLNCSDTSSPENKERLDKGLECLYKMFEDSKVHKAKNTWKDFGTKQVVTGFVKGITLVFLSIFCGSPVLLNYSAVLFKNSGSSFDPSLSSIIMISIQLISTTISLTLVDKVGRKILLIVSSAGTCVGFIAMGTYTYLSANGKNLDGYDWIPVTSISFAVFMAYIGLLPLVFVVLMEVLPYKVREAAATFCLSLVSLFMFTCVKVYPFAAEQFQMYTCMWFFAVISFIGVIFGIILEETKGKNINVSNE